MFPDPIVGEYKMEDDIVEWNGVIYRRIYYTSEQFCDGVKKYAQKILNDEAFEAFMKLGAHKKYDEIVERGEMFYTLKRIGIPARRICGYIEDVYDNIGELSEFIPVDD